MITNTKKGIYIYIDAFLCINSLIQDQVYAPDKRKQTQKTHHRGRQGFGKIEEIARQNQQRTLFAARSSRKRKNQQGYIIKTGPGYPIPMPVEDDSHWKDQEENVKYLPLQAKEGDLAIFLLNGAFEVVYEGEKYFIVPQSSILMLERETEL